MMTGQHTPETKARISATLKGRPRPWAVREKIRIGRRVFDLFQAERAAELAECSRAAMRAKRQDPTFNERMRAAIEASRTKAREPKPHFSVRWQRIADMRASGMTQREIAREIGTTHQRVSQILQKIARRGTA